MSSGVSKGQARTWLAVGGSLAGLAVVVLALAGPIAGQDPRPATRAAPRPEYARVLQVPGVIRPGRVDGVVRSVFRTQDERWTAVLLENQILATLEDREGVLEGTLIAVVTGVVSEYRGRNYLLLTGAEVRPAPVGG